MSLQEGETDVRVVLVTCADMAEAETIAKTIVLEGLAACVNVIGEHAPVRSFYQWEGALHQDREILLIIKTLHKHLASLEARILSLHGYTTPEFIALPVMAGSQAYLAWVTEATRRTPEPADSSIPDLG